MVRREKRNTFCYDIGEIRVKIIIIIGNKYFIYSIIISLCHFGIMLNSKPR